MLKPLSSLQKKISTKRFFKQDLTETQREKNGLFMRVSGSNLKEGKILILVDLHCKDRVSRGLS